MLLENKNAVVFGGGGAIGGAMARAFAREGARVFLAGRTAATLDRVADEIRAGGGRAETATVDALDEAAVDRYVDGVAAEAGHVDVLVCVISHGDTHGTPLADLTVADFERPILSTLRATFLTWRAAARHMRRQGSGVLLAFGGSGDPMRDYYIGGTQVSFELVEAMRRQFAAELGPHGVRTVTLRTGGVPETLTAGGVLETQLEEDAEQIAEGIEKATMLGRAATLLDVGNVAAFVASDHARTMTAATVNVSAGALVD